MVAFNTIGGLFGSLLRIGGLAFAILVSMASQATPVKTLLVFGDSLSAGYGIRLEQAWPSLLQDKLGKSWRVVNASQSGETTAGGKARLAAILQAHSPAVVIVELGANDGLRGLQLSQAKQNLAHMIEQAKTHGARVLLVGMRMPPNLGGPYTRRFATMFDELAAQYQLPKPPFLLEGLADQSAQFQADQLHPVAAAQPRLLANIWPSLQGLLQDQK